MKKEFREVDEKRGIVQVTISDERWYLKPEKHPTSMLPIYKGVPSVTWISQSYPKGIAFYKWLADKGWDEAEALKSAAGTKGSKVHLAIGDIIKGVEVRIDSKYLNKETGQLEELTLEECDCILSFKKWFDLVKPKVIALETVVFSDQHNYAGTVDFICEIDGETWIIDFKTGQYIWPEYELQVSAYKRTIENAENHFTEIKDVSNIRTAILQVGYKRNKDGYKFTELEDKFMLFQAAQIIWKNEHGGEQPSKKDYPIILSPSLSAGEVEFENNDQQSEINEASRGRAKTKTRN